jgi:hypothetical protein
METFIRFTKVEHSEYTTHVTRALVYDAHPAHNGELKFYLSFVLVQEFSDLLFDHVSASPFYTDNYSVKTKTGTSVEPYHLRNALEMVVQHLNDEVYLLEEGMLMCDGQFWNEK